MPIPLPDHADADAPLTAEQLAARQDVRPVTSSEDMRADIWANDREVDDFIEDTRRARQANVA